MQRGAKPGTKVNFYPIKRGGIQEYIDQLDPKLAAAVVAALVDIERHGIAAGTGVGYETKKLDSTIWEIKIKNQRFLYAHSNAREITILAAFRKETRKTPKDALRLAHHRARRLRP